MWEEMFSGGSLFAGLVSGGMSQLQHTNMLRKGHINSTEYAVCTTKNVSSAVGVMAGIEYGAMLGSAVMPGIGTVAGSIIGGMVGDRVGRLVGHHTGNMVFNNTVVVNEKTE